MGARKLVAVATVYMLVICGLVYGAVKVPKPQNKPKAPVAAASAVATRAPTVRPIKPTKVHTWKDLRDDLSKFHHRTIVEAYKEHGERDPKWDAKVLAFMEEYISLTLQQPDALEVKSFAAKAQELVDLGCTDPLVRSLCAMAFYVNSENTKAVKTMDKAFADLKSSHYSGWRIAAAGNCLADLYSVTDYKDGKNSMPQESFEYFAKSFKDGSFKPGEERIILYQFERLYDKNKKIRAFEAIKNAPGADPYLVKVIQAKDEMKQAWKARGGGYVYQTTREQWKGMSEHFAKARDLLVAAWKLHPEFPEAPAQMIEVAMADGDPEDGTPREWFDRTTAAEIDYLPAYDMYRQALLPRWGGSSEEMYQFGVQCLNTGLYETEVPWLFFSSLRAITDDLDGDKQYWRKPETAQYLETLYNGYAKTNPGYADHYKTLKAITAWYTGDYTKAKTLFSQLGDKYSRDAFQCNFCLKYDYVMKDCSMRASKFAPDIAKIDKLADAKKYSEALVLARKLAVKGKGDEGADRYVSFAVLRMEVLSSFYKGGWTKLEPRSNFAGWMRFGSEWSIEPGGTFVGHPSADPILMLASDMELGKRVEIKGEIEFEDKKTCARNAAIIFKHPAEYIYVSFYRDGNKVQISEHGARELASVSNAGVKDKNTFLVQYWDGLVTVYLNGKLVKKSFDADMFAHEDMQIGLSAIMWGDDEKVRFRGLQVRKLAKKP